MPHGWTRLWLTYLKNIRISFYMSKMIISCEKQIIMIQMRLNVISNYGENQSDPLKKGLKSGFAT